MEDVTYRVTETKLYSQRPTGKGWSVYRETVESPSKSTAERLTTYRKRSTAQAVAAILEALADQEV